jgi:serine/threonine protein kinase
MSRALGRYELLRPLARGGMAEVYLARRRAAGVEKWLVVKRMRQERAGDARFLDLFVREARLSMSLAHQNIVPVFDFGRIDDQVFIAMERVEGKDLGSSLDRAMQRPTGTDVPPPQPMPPLLAAFVAAECCQALDYAHRRRGPDGAALGIVHRDVTPRNVLLSWSGEVKLTDFGIAALAGDIAAAGGELKVIGTPAYMAPEQARGEPLDPRADVYALGLVLREALTGVRPRPGEEREATLAAARKNELLPWPEGFDSPLRAIVDRATAADREARHADARAMLEELDAFIVAERAAKKSDSPARKLAAWLAEVWKEEREETAIDEAIEGDHLVSFLDDGALDVIGTGTVRSMAVTASEAGVAPAEPAASASLPAAPAPAPAPAPPASTATIDTRRWIAALVGIGVLGLGGAFVVRQLAGNKPAAMADSAVVAHVDPPPVHVEAPVQVEPPVDAHVDPPPIDATPAVVQAPRWVKKHPTQQGSAAAPQVVLHTVRVNATPWAFFTIDSDPTQHQTLDNVKLSAGPHVLHFTRDAIQRDKAIVVPDNDDLAVVQDMR